LLFAEATPFHCRLLFQSTDSTLNWLSFRGALQPASNWTALAFAIACQFSRLNFFRLPFVGALSASGPSSFIQPPVVDCFSAEAVVTSDLEKRDFVPPDQPVKSSAVYPEICANFRGREHLGFKRI